MSKVKTPGEKNPTGYQYWLIKNSKNQYSDFESIQLLVPGAAQSFPGRAELRPPPCQVPWFKLKINPFLREGHT